MVYSVLSKLSQPETYQDPEIIKDIAAEALVSGNLRLVLGAGASMACGLPPWDQLVAKLGNHYGLVDLGGDLAEQSSALLTDGARGDRLDFARATQAALYSGYEHDMPDLVRHPLMIALGALTTSGIKSGISEIITFNYDDLLEKYLNYHGFIARSVARQPQMCSRCDVQVLHQHGLLPSDFQSDQITEIVFTEFDFDEFVGKGSDLWRQKVTLIMRSSICLFIGLSGNDPNLRSMLNEVNKNHPALEEQLYWGFRFHSDPDDRRERMFRKYGIKQITIDHDDIPTWLLSVVQRAATKRVQ